MQRFDSWDLRQTADFWSKKFKPKGLLNTTAFINSVISQQADSHMLEKYDINSLDEHTPGTAYIWSPITLDKPTYDEASYPYCYVYDIDKNWIYIDAIYDKHVNPTISLQIKIDFSYEQRSGKLKCKKEILNSEGTLPQLYVSKGWYANYRIYNEIGHLLDYVDRDSSLYRDSIVPILASLYLGPTYYHLLAVLNVMIGLPVAKYEGEVVLSVINGMVKTDKYSYPIGTIHTPLKQGDVLRRFQPITDVVELHTNEVEPQWWIGHPTAFFGKYTPGVVMNDDLRNYVMENYLSESVAGIEFRQDKLGVNPVNLNRQIQSIFLKAAPTHSDFLFAQSYHVGTSYDVYNLMTPNTDSKTRAKILVRSLFGRFTKDIGVNGQFCISSNLLPSPKIHDVYKEGKSLTFRRGMWHLYNEYDAFNDFWKFLDTRDTVPTYKVLFEPWADFVYLRLGTTPLFKDSERKHIPADLPEELKPTVFMNIGDPNKDTPVYVKSSTHKDKGLFSNMELAGSLVDINVPTSLAIQTLTTYSAQDILNVKFPHQWDRFHVTGVSKDNYFYITVQGDSTASTDKYNGYIISPELNLGVIPKNITPTITNMRTPPGAIIDLAYSLFDKTLNTWGQWIPTESDKKLYNITGKIKFKIRLFQNIKILDGNPTLSGVRVAVSRD